MEAYGRVFPSCRLPEYGRTLSLEEGTEQLISALERGDADGVRAALERWPDLTHEYAHQEGNRAWASSEEPCEVFQRLFPAYLKMVTENRWSIIAVLAEQGVIRTSRAALPEPCVTRAGLAYRKQGVMTFAVVWNQVCGTEDLHELSVVMASLKPGHPMARSLNSHLDSLYFSAGGHEEAKKLCTCGLSPTPLIQFFEANCTGQPFATGITFSGQLPEDFWKAIGHQEKKEQMEKNLGRAQGTVGLPSVLPPIADASPLSMTMMTGSKVGTGHAMEDRMRILAVKGIGVLAGVFDGHAGAAVSDLLARLFPYLFLKELIATPSDIRSAFERAALEAEQHIEAFGCLDGSTLVFSYVPQQLTCIFTATIGDSEAAVVLSKGTPLGLSPIVDWKSPKERDRARLALGKATWNETRFPVRGQGGLNVSRSLGDREKKWFHRPEWSNDDHRTITNTAAHLRKWGAVSGRPKVTLSPFDPGSTLLLYSDGVVDAQREPRGPPKEPALSECVRQELAKFVTTTGLTQLTRNIVDHAAAGWHQLGRRDDISILALRFYSPTES